MLFFEGINRTSSSLDLPSIRYPSTISPSYYRLGRVLTSSKPLGTLGMEQYFVVSTQKIAADWLSKSDRFQAFPPYLKILEEEEVFKQ